MLQWDHSLQGVHLAQDAEAAAGDALSRFSCRADQQPWLRPALPSMATPDDMQQISNTHLTD